MKALAHWAIHKRQKLRIAGRNAREIWGQLVASDGETMAFRYDRQSLRLTIGTGAAVRTVQLDPYGFERADA